MSTNGCILYYLTTYIPEGKALMPEGEQPKKQGQLPITFLLGCSAQRRRVASLNDKAFAYFVVGLCDANPFVPLRCKHNPASFVSHPS